VKAALQITSPLENIANLVPYTLYGKKPSYLVSWLHVLSRDILKLPFSLLQIYAGFVFTPLTSFYVDILSQRKQWPNMEPMRLVDLFHHGNAEKEGQQVVVLCCILSHPLNIGYDPVNYVPIPLISVDGNKTHCLADVVRSVEKSPGPFTKVNKL
jgi:hypothetical protein